MIVRASLLEWQPCSGKTSLDQVRSRAQPTNSQGQFRRQMRPVLTTQMMQFPILELIPDASLKAIVTLPQAHPILAAAPRSDHMSDHPSRHESHYPVAR